MSSLPRILVADNSRVVRATLAKHLTGRFDIVEEDNGEAAWQTLVLDAGIAAAIASVQMPQFGGHGLVAQAEDKAGEGGEAGSGKAAQPARRTAAGGEQPRLLSRQEIEARLPQALALSREAGEPLSVLVLEVGNHGALVARFGQEVTDKLCSRFSQLLLGTVRGGDSIGLGRPERCVIVSQGVGFSQCSAFAERLRASVAAAHIAVNGESIKLVVDAGVASAPEDHAQSAAELLALAISRMKTGPGSGGAAAVAKKAWLDIEIPALRTLASLLGNSPEEVEPYLGTLGVEVLPLLKAIDREFCFGLPLPEMEKRLADRARAESIRQ